MARKRETLKPDTQVPDGKGGAVDRNHPAAVKKELRALFREAFDQLGGAEWLVKFAQKDDQNARTFVQAVARMIPLELTGKDGAPLTIIVQKADGTQEPIPLPTTIEGSSERVH